MHPLRRSAALVAALLAPTMTSAQPSSRPPESQEPIPRELALALLNLTPAPGGVDIQVGKAPENVPPELLPPGLQILGSTTQFENATIVLAAPQQPDSAIAAIEAHLLKAGWTKPPVPVRQPQRGFVSADIGQYNYMPPDMLCRGDDFVMMSGSYRRSGGSVVKLAYNRGQQYSACKQREQMTTYRSPYDEAPMPILRAPQGSMPVPNRGGGMSSSGISITTGTRLKTALKPVELVAHYDKQMRDQGWAAIADGATDMVAARSYRKNDDKGATWTAVLISTRTPDAADQDVSLRLDRK